MGFNFEESSEKVWVDRFEATRLANNLFYLALISGKKDQTFVIDPVLAKKIAKYFSLQVAEIEKQIGQSLDDRLDNEPLPSPLDLRGSKDSGNK